MAKVGVAESETPFSKFWIRHCNLPYSSTSTCHFMMCEVVFTYPIHIHWLLSILYQHQFKLTSDPLHCCIGDQYS